MNADPLDKEKTSGRICFENIKLNLVLHMLNLRCSNVCVLVKYLEVQPGS